MLDYLEKLALFLHGFRWWFLALCAGVFVTLAIFDFRGHEIVGPFVLSFMWLSGIAFFVEFFQRTKRMEEAKRMKDAGPRVMREFVQSDAFWYFAAFFFLSWFVFMIFATIQFARS